MESARRNALESVVAEIVKGNTSLFNCTPSLPCETWRLCWRCRLKIKKYENIFFTSQCLTDRRSYGESDAVAALLDEVDDVPVVEGVDLHVVHGEDPVPDLEPAAPLCRGAWTEEI